MRDLIKELRTKGAMLLSDPPKPDDRLQAAGEIERLTACLTRIANAPAHHAGQTVNEYHFQVWAKEALSSKEPKT
jgi:hypothetical protein